MSQPAPGNTDLPGTACSRFRMAIGDPGASAEVRAHAEACPRCAAHAAFAQHAAAVLGTRPPTPARLTTPEFLAAIHERIVDGAATSRVFRALATPPAVHEDWPDPLLASSIACATITAPPSPSVEAWHRVHDAILADLAMPRRSWARRGWLASGFAAAAAITGLALTGSEPALPEIVFVDLDRAPNVEFTVVRLGEWR
jgi:hypothetical protein